MIGYVIYNGVDSRDYLLHVSGDPVQTSPDRDYDETKIKGRNGYLISDNGAFKNVELSYPCFIHKDYDMYASAVKNAFYKDPGEYHRLEDPYAPDYYRMALFKGIKWDTPKAGRRGATGKLNFSCSPQLFLFDGEKYIYKEGNATVKNPTNFPSRPLLVMWKGTMTINGKQIKCTCEDQNLPTYFDCETMIAYATNGQNRNQYIECDFVPEFQPGDNTVMFNGLSWGYYGRWWKV